MKTILIALLLLATSNAQAQHCVRMFRSIYQSAETQSLIEDTTALKQAMAPIKSALIGIQTQFAQNSADFKIAPAKFAITPDEYGPTIYQQKTAATVALQTYINAIDGLTSRSKKLKHDFAPFFGGSAALRDFLKMPSELTLSYLSNATVEFEQELDGFIHTKQELPEIDSMCGLEMDIANATGRTVRTYEPQGSPMSLLLNRLATALSSLSFDGANLDLASRALQAAQVYPTQPWQSAIQPRDAQRVVEILFDLGARGVSPTERFEVTIAKLIDPVASDLDDLVISFPRRSLARKLVLILNARSASDILFLSQEFQNMAKALNGGFLPTEERSYPL